MNIPFIFVLVVCVLAGIYIWTDSKYYFKLPARLGWMVIPVTIFLLTIFLASCTNLHTPDYYGEYDRAELRKIEMEFRLRRCRAQPTCDVSTIL